MRTYNVPDWLQVEQSRAQQELLQAGWPRRREEGWQHTNVEPFLKKEYWAQYPDQSQFQLPEELKALLADADMVLCFYNGDYLSANSKALLDEECLVAPLSRILMSAGRIQELAKFYLNRKPNSKLKAFGWQNQQNFRQGSFINIRPKEGRQLKVVSLNLYGSLQGVDQQKAFSVYPRNVISVSGKNQLDILEAHIAVNDLDFYISNATDVWVDKDCQVNMGQVLWSGGVATFINDVQAHVGAGSEFNFVQYVKSNELTRNEVEIHLNDPGAIGRAATLVDGQDKTYCDTSTNICHHKGMTKSVQIVKQMVADQAQASFMGRLLIETDAQKSDAQQMNHNLLLSDSAVAFSQPQLEVNADDVKAAHGATVGQIQETELFYLMSRAIPREQAMQLLTQGFKQDILSQFPQGFVCSRMRQILQGVSP